MWVFTTTGFISVVNYLDNSDFVMVRARDSTSLDSLASFGKDQIISSPLNDYPYRVIMKREVFRSWMDCEIQNIDYENFKNRVHETRGDDFADALLGVWSIMHDVEDERARKR